MFNFQHIVNDILNTSTSQNSNSKNYFDKLNEIIHLDKKNIDTKYKTLKSRVRGGK